MKKVLITGCRGQLGIQLAKQLTQEGSYALLLTDVDELDITNIESVTDFVRAERPDHIVNCAAFTAVDAAEEKEDLAFKINAIGPRNLAIAASGIGASLVHISTDYVFPGTEPRALTEFDAVGPVSAYGRTKLAGEEFVKQFSSRYQILRTAWLYGEGKNFVRTMLRLSETRQSITVVNDQFGSPTSTIELAKAVALLMPTDNYGLFHATCEGSTDWASFTKEIFRIKGLPTEVVPISTEEYQKNNPASAIRPHYSILDNYMLRLTTDHVFADWHEAIAEYLADE
ncbi:MAG: dTDP-4-dehydrorhamnose reductase [Lachnospiraceae bacterium]|nr:dTDP-4-dehydrorhamnose reductase [Lachnospiraceae bacterium]